MNLCFAELPSENHFDYDIIRSTQTNEIIGRRRNTKIQDRNIDEIVIRKSMLVGNSDSDPDYKETGKSFYYQQNKGYITIYALVIFNKDLEDYLKRLDNKYKDTWEATTNKGSITDLTAQETETYQKIGIDVYYYKNAPSVAIDYIRLETPHTKRFLWGEYDKEISNYISGSFQDKNQNSIDNDTCSVFRLTHVVEGDNTNWGGIKYLKNFVGDIFNAEIGPIYADMYNHYVGMADNWYGLFKVAPFVPVPYIKFGAEEYISHPNYALKTASGLRIYQDNQFPKRNIHWRIKNEYTLSLQKGAFPLFFNHDDKANSNSNYQDIKNYVLNSGYETYCINPDNNSTEELGNIQYNYNEKQISKFLRIDGINSFQNYYEAKLNCNYNDKYLEYDYYGDEFKRGISARFLYEDKNWWGQTFVLAEYKSIADDNTVGVNYTRPQTAEEVRLSLNNYLIMGAKGVLADGFDGSRGGIFFRQTILTEHDDPNGSIPKFKEDGTINKEQPWLVNIPRGTWMTDDNIRKYGTIRNPEIGDDYFNNWTRDVFLYGAFHKEVSGELVDLKKHFYRDRIAGYVDCIEKGDVRINGLYPKEPIFEFNQNSTAENPMFVEDDVENSFKTISKLMGLNYISDDNSRIYCGMRSVRFEFHKLYYYLSRPKVNDELMSSRLAAWYGKGYRKQQNYDEKEFTSMNPLSMIVDLNGVKTYPLVGYDFEEKKPIIRTFTEILPNGQEKSIQSDEQQLIRNQTIPISNRVDSGFYDITILRKLKNKAVENDQFKHLREGFILCVQNRRTDPLVIDSWLSSKSAMDDDKRTTRHFEFSTDDLDVFTKEKINFLSQAEFDDRLSSIPIQTINQSSPEELEYKHFGNMYWAKFGCRMIEIPLNIKALQTSSGTTKNQIGYMVSELGADDEALYGKFWRNNIYDNIIRNEQLGVYFGSGPIADPIFFSNAIKLYLQPGEAKYLNVTPIFFNKKCGSDEPIRIKDYVTNDHKFYDLITIFNRIEVSEKIINSGKTEGLSVSYESNCPVTNLPMSVEILDAKVEFAIATSRNVGSLMCNKINDSLAGKRRIYTFIIDSLFKGFNQELFYIAHDNSHRFPVRISYRYPEGDTVIYNEQIVYFGNSEYQKQTTEELTQFENGSILTNIKSIPNPAKSNFSLEFYSSIEATISIELIDNNGNSVILPIQLKTVLGQNTININCNNLSSGTYTVRISDNHAIINNHRISIFK